MLAQPHDDLFHCLFAHASLAGAWLRWLMPTQWHDEVEWHTLAPEPQKAHRPSLRQEVVDHVFVAARANGGEVQRLDEASIRDSPLPPTIVLTRLALRFFREHSDDDTLAALRRWGDLLRAADRETGPPAGADAIAAIACYCLRVREVEPRTLQQLLEHILQRPEHSVMSTAERLKREGLELGRHEGRVEGRAELLLLQLQKRFGSAAEDLAPRIRSASLAELDRWAERILDAATVEAVFAD